MTGPDWIDCAGLAWWQAHRIEPRVACSKQQAHFAVAEAGDHILTFFDDEDEFGVLTRQADGTLGGYSLYGDLIDAVRGLRLYQGA